VIAAKARTNPKECFNNLLHHLTYELVADCLAQLPNNSSFGVDGLTVVQAKENLSWLLPPILKQIHEGRYQPPAVKRVYIPKAGGKKRPIGIPAVIDRAIQAAMARILNEIYEQDFLKCSFGFRPRLGCHHALATINELLYRRTTEHALEVDIQDFFGSLSHEWLQKFLRLRIGDRRVLKLMESWLKAGVLEEGVLVASEAGVPQGGPISPLVANVYLHYVLDLWFEKKIKPKLRSDGHLVRYCDDFVILFRSEIDAADVETLLKARLSQFGLKVSDEKTHRTNLRSRESSRSHERRKMNFLGFTIYRAKNRAGKASKTVFETEGKRRSRARTSIMIKIKRIQHWPVENQAKAINAVLRGHFNYYGIAGNARRLVNFWYLVIREWRRSLSRRSQNGVLSWEQFNALLAKHPLVTPKVRIGYAKLSSYVRL
jgi:group II intron reverse transcriptase/maturase